MYRLNRTRPLPHETHPQAVVGLALALVVVHGSVYRNVPQPVVHCWHGVWVAQTVTVCVSITTRGQPHETVAAAGTE